MPHPKCILMSTKFAGSVRRYYLKRTCVCSWYTSFRAVFLVPLCFKTLTKVIPLHHSVSFKLYCLKYVLSLQKCLKTQNNKLLFLTSRVSRGSNSCYSQHHRIYGVVTSRIQNPFGTYLEPVFVSKFKLICKESHNQLIAFQNVAYFGKFCR